jgi:EAL domain-containing protein (putative c-di-GMP-specific phosphodiesterase class I)
MGCEVGQGHAIGRPMQAHDLTAWRMPAIS